MKNSIFVEKYRPKTVEDCILPDRTKNIFLNFVKDKSFPNLLLNGPSGTGKTSIARALVNQLNYEYLFIPASKDRNIDTVRNEITDFSSHCSFDGREKAIILDEMDGMTSITQDSLKSTIEEFPEVRFILTTNHKNRIIKAIQSRMATIDFDILADEKQDVMLKETKAIFEMLTKENITYDQKVVVTVIKKYFPDTRKTINELQRYAAQGGGVIDIGMLVQKEQNIKDLLDILRSKNFDGIAQWVIKNSEINYRQIWDGIETEIQNDNKAQILLVIADYQKWQGMVADEQLHTAALLTTIMREIKFK